MPSAFRYVSGNRVIRKDPRDPRTRSPAAWGKLLLRLIGKDIEFSTQLTTDDTTVVADSGQPEQVLRNLATNARDSMPDRGSLTKATKLVDIGRDSINAHGYRKKGAYTQITVTDTGSGFDEDIWARIFEPFFTTKEVGTGTGLDMIMPRMNGKKAYDEIRKMRPGIRVIFTSGYNPALVQKKGIREEKLDIVMKPISPLDLLIKVRRCSTHERIEQQQPAGRG